MPVASDEERVFVSAAIIRAPKIKPAQIIRKFRRSMAFIPTLGSLSRRPADVKRAAGGLVPKYPPRQGCGFAPADPGRTPSLLLQIEPQPRARAGLDVA